jgi:hypothetical protein
MKITIFLFKGLYGFSNMNLFVRRKREAEAGFLENIDSLISNAEFKYA